MNGYIIGIDIGGTMIKGALFDLQGGLIRKDETSTKAEKGLEPFIENIVSFVNLFQKGTGKASSLGIGIAGVLDKERETLLESPNLPLLKNVPLKKLLESELGIPVFIENDANIAALGELWAGDGKGIDNFLLLTLGTGIGSGLILNGNLWTGETGKAGEFGHAVVNPEGAQCACGKKGCLEAHSSGSAMVRMAREALAKGRESSLQNLYKNNPDALTPKAIYTEAKNGDELCLEIFKEAARFLAIAISDVNNLLDIHNFIIGGGVSKASHIFEAGLREEVKKRVFSVSKEKIRIIISKLGNDAGIFGAGYLAKQNIS
jgi:glucokinase